MTNTGPLNDNGRIKQATMSVKLDYLIDRFDGFMEQYDRQRELDDGRLRYLEVGQVRLDTQIKQVGGLNAIGNIIAAIAGIFIKPTP